jgi:hypothetical protein
MEFSHSTEPADRSHDERNRLGTSYQQRFRHIRRTGEGELLDIPDDDFNPELTATEHELID